VSKTDARVRRRRCCTLRCVDREMLSRMAFTAVDLAAVASGGAAIGTLALAGVTWRLASKTRDMAKASTDAVGIAERELTVVTDQSKATQAQVELSTQAMRASQQPLLVPVAEAPIRDGLQFTAHDGTTTSVQIGPGAKCWQEGGNGLIWAVIPMRNIGAGPARIPTDDKSVIAQFSLFGGLSAFGRPSQRVVAKDDTVYLVFCGPFGESSKTALALAPEEAGSAGIVCVQYTGIDQSHLSQTRLAYRYFRGVGLEDAVVTITDVPPGSTQLPT